MRKRNNSIVGYSIVFIISFCIICGTLAAATLMVNTSAAPAQILDTPLPLEIIIAQTSSAAQTQTMQAMPPTSLPTATLIPPIEVLPTSTVFIFELQTTVAQPTEFIFSTNTPFSLATQPLQTIQIIQATQPIQSEACSCSIDYNCPDFSSHTAAQTCFDYCKSKGYGDVHGLDRDDDNLACEDTNY